LRSRLAPAALVILSLVLAACHTPPVPPEAAQAERLEHELWRAGALIFTPGPYGEFKQGLRRAKDHLIKQKARFAWFRNYKDVRKEYQDLLVRGGDLHRTILALRRDRTRSLRTELEGIRSRLAALHATTESMNEGRLARSSLTRAEVAADQAAILLDKEEYDGAARKIGEAEDFFREGRETLQSLLARYFDPGQVREWKRLVEATIAESRRGSGPAIVVYKLERQLIVYKAGRAAATYGIGLGRFGLSRKLSAGDSATPEGRYRVTRKFLWTRFYKALMLDYPNADDRKDFARAKKKGLLPAGAGIGGLIEIHGGGTDGLTEGCVGVDNATMDMLFPLVAVGTPVTIVGTLKSEPEILAFLNIGGSGQQ
jgi:hypothetical protein